MSHRFNRNVESSTGYGRPLDARLSTPVSKGMMIVLNAKKLIKEISLGGKKLSITRIVGGVEQNSGTWYPIIKDSKGVLHSGPRCPYTVKIGDCIYVDASIVGVNEDHYYPIVDSRGRLLTISSKVPLDQRIQ